MTAPHTISVMKFGGSSFATPAHFAPICRWITQRLQQEGSQHRLVCVVSAPSGLTEQYRNTLLALNPVPSARLIDASLPLADSLGATLVAAALQAQGATATVALGNQIGLRTDINYTRARLQRVDLAPMRSQLENHQVVVVPGGQASAIDTAETTWMGKNSSDLSAIALAAAFECEEIEIYSDVPGVYSCDPHIVAEAALLPYLPHAQAIEMSISGAKVLHHRAVQHALHSDLRIVCRRNHGDFDIGTVLQTDGRFEPVVVPDMRSQCFAGAHATVEEAARLLDAAAVPHRVLPGPEAATRRLVVTCGFFDAVHFLKVEHGLALREEALKLVTVIAGDGGIVRELVAPAEAAERANRLHAEHCTPADSKAPRADPTGEAKVMASALRAIHNATGASHV
jgi:aspartate kinase